MGENLVIVESPAKAKTIEKILGKDYIVKSSLGHIRDLPKKGLGIDIENGFEPEYEVSKDKKAVVADLQKYTKSVKQVWIASDEDREGEAIAWHLSKVLNIDPATKNRIVFHEITPSAIKHAMANPRTIDINLVEAQQARRILDRLVGFELSPILWKKVRPSLSAGRVQSVAVRVIVEREREIIAFSANNFYKVSAVFSTSDKTLKTELSHRFDTEQEALSFLNDCIAKTFSVEAVEKKAGSRTPSAPFTTSTLQQEASRRLGFSVSQTMRVAQSLYESGLITYMRTDSVNLSNDAIAAISSTITDDFGKKYLKVRKYTTKSKGAQEAHEAIRPSYFSNQRIEGTPQEQKLYSLIWKRTVASQMADAVLERTIIKIQYPLCQYHFEAKGEIVVFDGFLKLYDNQTEDLFLPNLKNGDVVTPLSIEAIERFDQRPSRYSEAALVRQLEELGIGRPSTYAPTISTIINRGYVVKEDRDGVERKYSQFSLVGKEITKVMLTENTGADKAKLFPTDIGMIVNDYLKNHFKSILDYNFTASVEERFDDIAEGKIEWKKMLKEFYGDFHNSVEAALTEDGGYATQEVRLLGVDQSSGKNVYARMGRFGPMVQLGENNNDDDSKPQYAGLGNGQLIETVTLEQALELFRLPRTVGAFEEKTVVIGIGRFGAYIRHNNKFVSLPKDYNPYTVTLEESISLIEDKRRQDIERVLKTFPQDDKLQILNGRWGAYVYYDGVNFKVDKSLRDTLKDISFEDAMKIVGSGTGTKQISKARKPKVSAKKTTTSTKYSKNTAKPKVAKAKKTASK